MRSAFLKDFSALIAKFEFEPGYVGQVAHPAAAITMSKSLRSSWAFSLIDLLCRTNRWNALTRATGIIHTFSIKTVSRRWTLSVLLLVIYECRYVPVYVRCGSSW